MEEKKASGKGIGSFVCGVLSIFLPGIGFILGILAIIFGILSKNEINRWRGLALAGFICGIIGIIMNLCIIFIILFLIKIITSPIWYWQPFPEIFSISSLW